MNTLYIRMHLMFSVCRLQKPRMQPKFVKYGIVYVQSDYYFPIFVFHLKIQSRCLVYGVRFPVSDGAASQKTYDRVFVQQSPRRSVFLSPKPNCKMREGEVLHTRLVPCVNRLRTACTRTVTISLPKNYNPKEKIQSGQRHYAIVYEEKKICIHTRSTT